MTPDCSVSICKTITPHPREGSRWRAGPLVPTILSQSRSLATRRLSNAHAAALHAPSAIKVGMVRVAERVGRLKLNGRLFERSPLSSVIELETLVVGVRGKEALWMALQRANVGLEDVDLDALAESARAQGAELRRYA